MMQPGSVDTSGAWVEAQSLARSIEVEMIAAEILDLDEETEEATTQRRKTFVAMSRAIVNHLKLRMDIEIQAGDLRDLGESNAQLPRSDKTYTVSGGQITIGAGTLRPASDSGVRVPLLTKVLTTRVR